MDYKFEGIIRELKSFFKSEFGRNYFTIIYGSYAYGINTSNSDLDFVTVSQNFNRKNLKSTLQFAFDLYKRYELAFDDEVPHENKLLADYTTLNDAINGMGFERRKGRIYVPPIVKTKEFLGSDEIAMRILLNAITSKNVFVGGDENYYLQRRKKALENMVGFMFSIDGTNSFTISELVQSLIGTPERHGEMYLGYKDKPAIREYLNETFGKEFDRLAQRNILKQEDVNYSLINSMWLKQIVD